MLQFIIPIHGTGDDKAYVGTGDPAWWHPHGYFANIVKTNLNDVEVVKLSKPHSSGHEPMYEGRDYEWKPFQWSGENSERARTTAGRALAEKIVDIVRDCAPETWADDNRGPVNEGTQVKQEQKPPLLFYLVAHSHGGNVAIDALIELQDMKRRMNAETRSEERSQEKRKESNKASRQNAMRDEWGAFVKAIKPVSRGWSVDAVEAALNALFKFLAVPVTAIAAFLDAAFGSLIVWLFVILGRGADFLLRAIFGYWIWPAITFLPRWLWTTLKGPKGRLSVAEALSKIDVGKNVVPVLVGVPLIHLENDWVKFLQRVFYRLWFPALVKAVRALILPSLLLILFYIGVDHPGPETSLKAVMTYFGQLRAGDPKPLLDFAGYTWVWVWSTPMLDFSTSWFYLDRLFPSPTGATGGLHLAGPGLWSDFAAWWNSPRAISVAAVKWMALWLMLRPMIDALYRDILKPLRQARLRIQLWNDLREKRSESGDTGSIQAAAYGYLDTESGRAEKNFSYEFKGGPDAKFSEISTGVGPSSVRTDSFANNSDEAKSVAAENSTPASKALRNAIVLTSRHDEAVLALRDVVGLRDLPLAQPTYVQGLSRLVIFLLLLLLALGLWLYGLGHAATDLQKVLWGGLFTVTGAATMLSQWIAKPVATMFNHFIAGIARARVLGDDLSARPVQAITPYLPVPHGDRWYPLAEGLDSEQQGAISRVAPKLWARAKEVLVVAQFAGNSRLVGDIQNGAGLIWDTLVHTTYFTNPVIANFLSYVLVDRIVSDRLSPKISNIKKWRYVPPEKRPNELSELAVYDGQAAATSPITFGSTQETANKEEFPNYADKISKFPDYLHIVQPKNWTNS